MPSNGHHDLEPIQSRPHHCARGVPAGERSQLRHRISKSRCSVDTGSAAISSSCSPSSRSISMERRRSVSPSMCRHRAGFTSRRCSHTRALRVGAGVPIRSSSPPADLGRSLAGRRSAGVRHRTGATVPDGHAGADALCDRGDNEMRFGLAPVVGSSCFQPNTSAFASAAGCLRPSWTQTLTSWSVHRVSVSRLPRRPRLATRVHRRPHRQVPLTPPISVAGPRR